MEDEQPARLGDPEELVNVRLGERGSDVLQHDHREDEIGELVPDDRQVTAGIVQVRDAFAVPVDALRDLDHRARDVDPDDRSVAVGERLAEASDPTSEVDGGAVFHVGTRRDRPAEPFRHELFPGGEELLQIPFPSALDGFGEDRPQRIACSLRLPDLLELPHIVLELAPDHQTR